MSSSLTTRPQWSDREMRSFAFGVEMTIPNILSYFDSAFWKLAVPQLGQEDPAVRYALTSLAAFHEKMDLPSIADLADPEAKKKEIAIHNFSLKQYNNSILALNRQMDAQGYNAVKSVMVCCMLYICIETLRGDPGAMISHIQNGLKVYNEWLRKVKGSHDISKALADPSSLEGSISRTFSRMDSTATTFVDDHEPQFRTLSLNESIKPSEPAQLEFGSIEQARVFGDRLTARLFHFLKTNNTYSDRPRVVIPQRVLDTYSDLSRRIREYGAALRGLVTTLEKVETAPSRGILIMEMRHAMMIIFHRKWPNEAEATERCDLEFETVISLANTLTSSFTLRTGPSPISWSETASSRTVTEAGSAVSSPGSPTAYPVFTLEAALIPALWYTSQASHSSYIRQAAVLALQQANLREGLWSSRLTAEIAQESLRSRSGARRPIYGAEVADLGSALWKEFHARVGSPRSIQQAE